MSQHSTERGTSELKGPNEGSEGGEGCSRLPFAIVPVRGTRSTEVQSFCPAKRYNFAKPSQWVHSVKLRVYVVFPGTSNLEVQKFTSGHRGVQSEQCSRCATDCIEMVHCLWLHYEFATRKTTGAAQCFKLNEVTANTGTAIN